MLATPMAMRRCKCEGVSHFARDISLEHIMLVLFSIQSAFPARFFFFSSWSLGFSYYTWLFHLRVVCVSFWEIFFFISCHRCLCGLFTLREIALWRSASIPQKAFYYSWCCVVFVVMVILFESETLHVSREYVGALHLVSRLKSK